MSGQDVLLLLVHHDLILGQNGPTHFSTLLLDAEEGKRPRNSIHTRRILTISSHRAEFGAHVPVRRCLWYGTAACGYLPADGCKASWVAVIGGSSHVPTCRRHNMTGRVILTTNVSAYRFLGGRPSNRLDVGRRSNPH